MSGIHWRLGQRIGALFLALASLSAHADFAADVTVKLIAPGGLVADATPISLSQTVTVANFVDGVRAGNLQIADGAAEVTGDISGFMLDNERVSFVGNAIHIRAAVGDDTGDIWTTGYLGAGGSHARYEIQGLAIPGQAITGFAVYAFDGYTTSGTTGLLSPADPSGLVQLTGGGILSFNLDSIVFAHRVEGSGLNYAEFRIDLLTTPVPEPATWLLLAGGLLLLRRRVRAS